MKALEKKPDERFDGCKQFLNYIRDYESEDVVINKTDDEIKIKPQEKKTEDEKLADTSESFTDFEPFTEDKPNQRKNKKIEVNSVAEEQEVVSKISVAKTKAKRFWNNNKEGVIIFFWIIFGLCSIMSAAEIFEQLDITFFSSRGSFGDENTGGIIGATIVLIIGIILCVSRNWMINAGFYSTLLYLTGNYFFLLILSALYIDVIGENEPVFVGFVLIAGFIISFLWYFFNKRKYTLNQKIIYVFYHLYLSLILNFIRFS